GAREPREVDAGDILCLVGINLGFIEPSTVAGEVIGKEIARIADAASSAQAGDGRFRVRKAILKIEAIVHETLRAAVVIVDQAGERYPKLIATACRCDDKQLAIGRRRHQGE